MSRSASDIALAAVFGTLIVALAYPVAAPAIASATTVSSITW